ncbi:aspartyl protease family protein [Desulfomarina sp.]
MARTTFIVILGTILLFFYGNLRADPGDIQDPYEVLLAHYNAIGGLEKLKTIKSSYSEGLIRLDGMQGKFRHWEKGPLQYRTEEKFDAVFQTDGDSGEVSWQLDTNGQVLLFKDRESKKRREIARRIELYEHLNRDSPVFTLTLEASKVVKGQECYQVLLSNRINKDISRFFINKKTLLMVKSISRQPDMEVITYYNDYRWVEGVQIPFHDFSTYLPWEKEEETTISRYKINPAVNEDLFAVPERKRDFHFLTSKDSAVIPFLFAENIIYLEVSVKDNTRYWVLDSGASMSVIDAEYAKELQLQQHGRIKGHGFGDLFSLSFATLPTYRVGSVLFDPQTVFVVKNLTKQSYEPEIAGILGYDFLSRFVVEIDYDQKLVILHDPEHYQGNSCAGTMVEAPLKYRTFTIPVTLDHKYRGDWSLDLGAHTSSIHFSFAEKNNLLQRRGIETISQGISGISFEKTVQFIDLETAGFHINYPLVTMPLKRGKGATALGEIAGNLGNDILSHFNLILDYRNQQVIFMKGRNFQKHQPRDKSGILIGRSEFREPMVSFVASGSPGYKAGFLAGDIIVRIDERNIPPGTSVLPLRDILRQEAGTTHVFTVVRNGRQIRLPLTLANLFPVTPESVALKKPQ